MKWNTTILALVGAVILAMGGICLSVSACSGQSAQAAGTSHASAAPAARSAHQNPGKPPSASPDQTGAGPDEAQHSVTLSWNPSTTSTVVSYNVYRRNVLNNTFSPGDAIASVPASEVSYVDTNVAGGDNYYYGVTAVDSTGAESDFSNIVQVLVPSSPSQPNQQSPAAAADRNKNVNKQMTDTIILEIARQSRARNALLGSN